MNPLTPNSPSADNPEFRPPLSLRQLAILKTLVYSDIFDFPLTYFELHSYLMSQTLTLSEVRDEVRNLYESGFLTKPTRYICLAGREQLLSVRQDREAITRALLRKNQFWLDQICSTPFIRMVAISGAAAHGNCVAGDDIDLFIITEPKRLWTVYASLALIHKLFGKRRTLCLNYLITTGNPGIDEKEPFVAHEIVSLRVISGLKIFDEFIKQNIWVREYYPNWEAEMTKPGDDKSGKFRDWVETLFALPIFNWVEEVCYRFYLRRWKKYINDSSRPDSISLTRDRIKIYTNDHRDTIQEQYQKRIKEVVG